MSIGSMKVRKNENGDYIAKGTIKTLQTRLTFLLNRHPDAGKRENAPTHVAEVKLNDEYIPVGQAWLNDIGRGDKAGQKMFSISLTEPSFPEWTRNIAAFPTGEMDEEGNAVYEIQQSRPRQSGASAEL